MSLQFHLPAHVSAVWDNPSDTCNAGRAYFKATYIQADIHQQGYSCLCDLGSESVERAIDQIKDLPNVWYDFSSATNADVFMLAFKYLPMDRLMYGSDIPGDLLRGNLVSFGLGWELLTEKHVAAMNITHCDNRCTYVLYEMLRALRRAVRIAGLEARQIEDLFFNNAVRFVHG